MSTSRVPFAAVSNEEIYAFRLDGDTVIPTEYSRGPWFDDQQHGAAVCGLMARFLERVPSAQPMRFTRITTDMSRPVPMVPCKVTARPLRDGRRVQSLEAILEVDDKIVGRAVATRIRVEPGLVPADKVAPVYPEDEPPPWIAEESGYPQANTSFHDCIEVRGGLDDDKLRGLSWLRLRHPLIKDEEPSPLVRLASVSDFVHSSAARLGRDWISINPEVSLQVERDIVGEWVAIQTTVRLDDDGLGVSEAVLFDRHRRVGRTSKSTLNMPRA
jgi:Acyl-CoA thioesterase C-terminal domain/Acyl-CoA thioesterase N-terminal domain